MFLFSPVSFTIARIVSFCSSLANCIILEQSGGNGATTFCLSSLVFKQDGNSNPIVYAKFFFPAGGWTWFITEGEQDGDDFLFFGYVIGHEREWGYFSLREMEGIHINGLAVERDLYFDAGSLSSVLAEFDNQKEE